jgi:hypothetical protein
MAIWYDRNNTSGLDCHGNGAGVFYGTIYAPSAALWMTGNGTCQVYNSLVIVASVRFSGSPSACGINYVTDQNVQVPWGDSRLVE